MFRSMSELGRTLCYYTRPEQLKTSWSVEIRQFIQDSLRVVLGGSRRREKRRRSRTFCYQAAAAAACHTLNSLHDLAWEVELIIYFPGR